MTLTANQIAAVRDVEATWPNAMPTLIGAAALGFHLDLSWRTTSDIDLIVALDFDVFPDDLLQRDGWTRHREKSQTFFSPSNCQVDLVPVGHDSLRKGVLIWPDDGFEMSVIGLDLAFAHRQERQVIDNSSVYVAPASVVAFLKMVSYLDRPYARQRDLSDIAHLLEGYVDEIDDRRWSAEVHVDVDFDLVSAFLLGKDVASVLLDAAQWGKVDAFMTGACDEQSVTHAKMSESCSSTSRSLLPERLRQLRAGLDQGRP